MTAPVGPAEAGRVGHGAVIAPDGNTAGSRRPYGRTIPGLCLALLWIALPAAARGDGGALRAWRREGHHEIAVFTEPTPFVAGPVDISVLLLDPTTGEPIPEAHVTVEVSPEGWPDRAAQHPATRDAASNKLLYAAVFELRHSGRCDVKVIVDGPADPAEIRFTVDVARPSTFGSGFWPWVLWPVPVIAAYGIHRRLVGQRHRPMG